MGDRTSDHPRESDQVSLEEVRAAGGRYDVVDLPKIGMRGNSHMIMMDRNSDQVADVIQSWLEKQGLYR